MTNDPVARLAAANPVPLDVLVRAPAARPRRRVPIALVAAACAVAIPAVAFADDIGGLLGFSNQGTAVQVSSTPIGQSPELMQVIQSMDVPSTMHLLGTRDGFSFYAARKPDGNVCFGISNDAGEKGLGCTIDGGFPSASRPVLLFPTPVGAPIVGFAIDGVASVELLDASGATVASAPVSDNIFVGDVRPDGAVAIEALDGSGAPLATRPLPG
ncbi:MAG TPA: hypothetical protein VLW05_03705 [Gaiellaceae bacterium]|nr:hypothetical protein [Gaiellaceae bacterium]